MGVRTRPDFSLQKTTLATPRGVYAAGFSGRKSLYDTFHSYNISPFALHCARVMFVRQSGHEPCSALSPTYPSRPPVLRAKAWCVENELVIQPVLHLLHVIYAPGSNPGHVTSCVMETLQCYVETDGDCFHIHCVNVPDLRVFDAERFLLRCYVVTPCSLIRGHQTVRYHSTSHSMNWQVIFFIA